MYLPLAGVVALVTLGAYLGWQSVLVRMSRKCDSSGAARWAVPTAVLVAIVTGLGYQTYQRNKDYRSEMALWQDNLRKDPDNFRSHSGIGTALMEAGRLEEAVHQFTRSIELNPKYSQAWVNRGYARYRQGNWMHRQDYDRGIELIGEMPRRPGFAVCSRKNAGWTGRPLSTTHRPSKLNRTSNPPFSVMGCFTRNLRTIPRPFGISPK